MQMYQLSATELWQNYELIDCGEFEKLERFGKYILRRPEPQAVWPRRLSETEWNRLPHATYERLSEKQQESRHSEKGVWEKRPDMPDSWPITYTSASISFSMRLALTSFGHVGIFPEQAANWEYIAKALQRKTEHKPAVLNMFAYTGGASLTAAACGAIVTHLDSVKQTVNWANQNRQLNAGLPEMRWMVEDALKYAQREVKRGKVYDGIILDPPAYGRGPNGEKWVLEENLNELFELSAQLLSKHNSFFITNLYSMGLSSLVLENLTGSHFTPPAAEAGEIYTLSGTGIKLPLGTFVRFMR